MSKFNELIQGDVPVAVQFVAEWAPTSDSVTEDLKQLKEDVGIELKLVKVDFDKNEGLAAKLGVVGVPTVILFKSGKKILSSSGKIDLDLIKSKL